jgi:DNA-binding transcriptional LysR family regulator
MLRRCACHAGVAGDKRSILRYFREPLTNRAGRPARRTVAFTRITPRQLETFVAVAELRSFSAAGERLGLTPSAISQLIADLEGVVGFRLFDRTTRKVAPSAAGREFLGPAESALRHLRLAESAAADVRSRNAGVVRIAATMVMASMILPGAIRDYVATRPKVTVRIRDVSVEGLVDAVASGDADLALGPDRTTGDEVQRTALFDSPWVLWCAPTHALAARRTLRWRDLREQPLVAAGRHHERSVAQMRAGVPEGERITPIDVVDNISTALGIAAQGLAATLSPAYVAALAEPLGLVMRRIVDPEVMRQVCLYRPARRATSPAAEGFEEHVAAWMTQWHRAHGMTKRRR